MHEGPNGDLILRRESVYSRIGKPTVRAYSGLAVVVHFEKRSLRTRTRALSAIPRVPDLLILGVAKLYFGFASRVPASARVYVRAHV